MSSLDFVSWIPQNRISLLLHSIDNIDVKENEFIIKQGDESDYFYVVKSGNLRIFN